MSNPESALTRLDFARVQDFLLTAKARVEAAVTPSSGELVQRRLAVHRVRDEIRSLFQSKELCSDAEADWRALDPIIVQLMLENFTRQVGDSEGITTISRYDVKDHHYVAPSSQTERRTYMGLHKKPYDNDGLSVVTAYKPTLHQQPFHAHRVSGENSLAIHPTSGYAFLSTDPTPRQMSAKPGQMLVFSPYTPHTLRNPTLNSSADVSVKVPQALRDRIPFTPRALGDYLAENTHRYDLDAHFRIPCEVKEGDGYREVIYRIQDCGRKYFVHFIMLDSGKDYETLRGQEIRSDSVEIFQGFAVLGELDISLEISDGTKKSNLNFGDYGVVPPETSAYSVKNLGQSPVSIYRAYEVKSDDVVEML